MITAFVSAFVLVLTRAFQQLNVIHHLYLPAFFTSFVIAAGEIGVITSGVIHGWNAVPPIGLGGAIGVVSAMYFHNKIFKRRRNG